MRFSPAAAAVALLVAPLIADGGASRPSVRLDLGLPGPARGPSVASGGDLSAVVWNDGTQSAVYCSTSSGTGIAWSPPLRIDGDPTASPKFTQSDAVAILGDDVFILWRDERASDGAGQVETDLFLEILDTGTGTLLGERWIDKGYPKGKGAVHDWRMVVTSDGSGDHVYVLLVVAQKAGSARELYLVASDDGGASFAAPKRISPGLGEDVDAIALAAVGSAVHVAWEDDRHGQDDVFYRRSLDGGATFSPSDVQLDASGPSGGNAGSGLELAVTGSTVVVAWPEAVTSPTIEELRVNVSTDGGIGFRGDRLVGSYVAGGHDVDDPSIGIDAVTGDIIVAWVDRREKKDHVFACVSVDGGLTWGGDAERVSC